MKTISDTKVTLRELKDMSAKMFGNIVKAVVDIERKIMIIDAELHADQESELLKSGSRQHDLWGINLHPDQYGTENFIEYDSMINLRPTQGNRSRGVEDSSVRNKIVHIVESFVNNE